MPRKSLYKPLPMPKKSKIFKFRLPPKISERRWWTLIEIKRVTILAERERLSATRIGQIVNRSRAAVVGLCYRQGIKLHGESGAPFGNKNRLGGLKNAAD